MIKFDAEYKTYAASDRLSTGRPSTGPIMDNRQAILFKLWDSAAKRCDTNDELSNLHRNAAAAVPITSVVVVVKVLAKENLAST